MLLIHHVIIDRCHRDNTGQTIYTSCVIPSVKWPTQT